MRRVDVSAWFQGPSSELILAIPRRAHPDRLTWSNRCSDKFRGNDHKQLILHILLYVCLSKDLEIGHGHPNQPPRASGRRTDRGTGCPSRRTHRRQRHEFRGHCSAHAVLRPFSRSAASPWAERRKIFSYTISGSGSEVSAVWNLRKPQRHDARAASPTRGPIGVGGVLPPSFEFLQSTAIGPAHSATSCLCQLF
jgi:hypothetical protein